MAATLTRGRRHINPLPSRTPRRKAWRAGIFPREV